MEQAIQEILLISRHTNDLLNDLSERVDQLAAAYSSHEKSNVSKEIYEEVNDHRKLTTKVIDDYFGDRKFILANKPLGDILGQKNKFQHFPYQEERNLLHEVFQKIIDNFYNVKLLLECQSRDEINNSQRFSNSITLVSLKIADILTNVNCLGNNSKIIYGSFRKQLMNSILYHGKILFPNYLIFKRQKT
jgi:hypothetical protein